MLAQEDLLRPNYIKEFETCKDKFKKILDTFNTEKNIIKIRYSVVNLRHLAAENFYKESEQPTYFKIIEKLFSFLETKITHDDIIVK
jgi:hypothetical protein